MEALVHTWQAQRALQGPILVRAAVLRVPRTGGEDKDHQPLALLDRTRTASPLVAAAPLLHQPQHSQLRSTAVAPTPTPQARWESSRRTSVISSTCLKASKPPSCSGPTIVPRRVGDASTATSRRGESAASSRGSARAARARARASTAPSSPRRRTTSSAPCSSALGRARAKARANAGRAGWDSDVLAIPSAPMATG